MAAPPSGLEDVASKDEDSVGDQQTLLNQAAACYSDSADSDQSKHYSKKRFSPFQVETLKRVFGQSPYITQSQAATLARRTGLKKLQVRKWFSDYRCKIKKQSILLEQFSTAHAAAVAAAAAAAAKVAPVTITPISAVPTSAVPAASSPAYISLLDDEEPEPNDDNEMATEELEQDSNVLDEEDGCEEEEEEENEEEEAEEATFEEAEAEEEADADDDTDVDMNAEIDQMIAARSVRPITIVFGKRSRKRAKKREKERAPGSVVSGPSKRGRKKKKKDAGSDSGGGCCSGAADNQSQTVKRFSPHQVEMLKRAYADSPYITQRQAAVLARSIGLKKMQVRKWFCDHRCKIKKQSQRLQTEGFGSMEMCERKVAAALVVTPAQIPSGRKSLLERLTGDQPRVDVKVEDDDENVDFTDSDDPHAANGLDDPKSGQSKSRIILPRRTFRFNEKQLAVLNEEFDKSQFLNEDTLTFLCDKLQERRERIQTWFKMRRYKLRQSEQRFWQNIMDSS